MGLIGDLARLEFEFGVTVNAALDYNVQAWPALKESMGGGLSGLANTILSTSVPKAKKVTMSDWCTRPLSQAQIAYASRDGWLSWRIAIYFIEKHGEIKQASNDITLSLSLIVSLIVSLIGGLEGENHGVSA